jgi:hypothetical protein
MPDKPTDAPAKPPKNPRRWQSRAQRAMIDKAKDKQRLAALARARLKGVMV